MISRRGGYAVLDALLTYGRLSKANSRRQLDGRREALGTKRLVVACFLSGVEQLQACTPPALNPPKLRPVRPAAPSPSRLVCTRQPLLQGRQWSHVLLGLAFVRGQASRACSCKPFGSLGQPGITPGAAWCLVCKWRAYHAGCTRAEGCFGSRIRLVLRI